MITEWNTVIHLKDNLWLKIEEPKKPKVPKEVEVTLHRGNPNDDKSEEIETIGNIEYEDYQEDEDEDDDE